jgi:hypothetical protein
MPVTKDYVADYGADDTGVSDNCEELSVFGTFAKAQGTDPVTLNIPAGTFLHDTNPTYGNAAQTFSRGVDFLTVQGAGSQGAPTGTTFQQTSGRPQIFYGSLGQGTEGYRINTVNAGSTSVFTMTEAEADDLTVGGWVLISGIDLQGRVDSDYGFPTNAHFFDFAKVVSKNSTTGEVALDRALEDSYKSTWALQYDGTGGGLPQGGPGYIYPLDATFEQTVVVDGILFELYDASTPAMYTANASDITFRNSVTTGTAGPTVSQAVNARWQNLDLTDATVEVDKLIQNFYLDNVTCNSYVNSRFFFQSSSVKNLYVTNSDIKEFIGLGRNNTISDSTIELLRLENSYGAAKRTTLTNNTISAIEADNGPGTDFIATVPMTDGVIRFRRKAAVLGIAASPAGKVRLTVADTTDIGTGHLFNDSDIFTNRSENQYTVTVVDSTHLDITTVDFATGGSGGVPLVWTGSGMLLSDGLSWAIPGYYVNMNSGTTGVGVVGNFRVLDQWNDTDYIYVQTNLAGTWPSNVASIGLHSCPDLRATGNVGCPEIVEQSLPEAYAKPIWSYSYREYDHTHVKDNLIKPKMWGTITSIKVNVVTPYTGTWGSLKYRQSEFNNWPITQADGTTYMMDLRIDVRTAGLRVITPSGNTGIQAGDTVPTLAVGDRMGGVSNNSPVYENGGTVRDVSGEGLGPFLSVEIITDQGIVNLPTAVVPLRLRLRAA